MEQLIKNILTNNDFSYNEQIRGYELSDKSYFFIETIGIDQLEEIKSKNSLRDCTWYQVFISLFNETCGIPEYSSIEKNSALLILVECGSMENLNQFQAQILLLEEDQFFVKKYVFIYTTNALSKIPQTITNENLQVLVRNSPSFEIFRKNGIIDQIDDYIVVLQLFIKLPFLKLKFEDNDFVGLEEKLRISLTTDLTIYQNLIESFDDLKTVDFIAEESDTDIDNLIASLGNDTN
jgi:hypothetical protein